jgi:leucyl-tRNA synthetase
MTAEAPSLDPSRLTEEGRGLRRVVHKTIRKVTDDIEERFHFNTAIAAIMEMVNALAAFEPKHNPANAAVMREALTSLVLMLAPFIPHAAEELWEGLGNGGSIADASWPSCDPDAAADEELLVVVQVNGKLRDRITVPASATEESVTEAALAAERVRSFIEGKTVRKVITVPGKLVNIVVG